MGVLICHAAAEHALANGATIWDQHDNHLPPRHGQRPMQEHIQALAAPCPPLPYYLPDNRWLFRLHALRAELPRGAQVWIESDGQGLDENAASGVQELSASVRLHMVRIHDPAEAELPAVGRAVFEDLASGALQWIDSSDAGLRRGLHEQWQGWRERQDEQMRRCGIGTVVLAAAGHAAVSAGGPAPFRVAAGRASERQPFPCAAADAGRCRSHAVRGAGAAEGSGRMDSTAADRAGHCLGAGCFRFDEPKRFLDGWQGRHPDGNGQAHAAQIHQQPQGRLFFRDGLRFRRRRADATHFGYATRPVAARPAASGHAGCFYRFRRCARPGIAQRAPRPFAPGFDFHQRRRPGQRRRDAARRSAGRGHGIADPGAHHAARSRLGTRDQQNRQNRATGYSRAATHACRHLALERRPPCRSAQQRRCAQVPGARRCGGAAHAPGAYRKTNARMVCVAAVAGVGATGAGPDCGSARRHAQGGASMSAWLSALPALWQQIQWRWPWAALLAAVPLLFVYAHRFARQRTLSYADPQLWPWAVGTLRLPRSQAARLWFEAIGWMLLALALAGPRWPALQDSPDGRVSQSRQGAHIVVIVQISDSMQANDVAPNRLTRARLALQDSLQRLRGERLSLIAYGATAGVLLPATHDRGLFAQALQWLDGDLLPTSGSNLGHALALALEQIRRAGSRQNAVLLITDADPESLQGKGGEEVQGAVDAMRAQEAPLYAWFAMPQPSLLPGEGMRPASGGTDQAFDVDPYRRLINMTGGGTSFLADSGFGWNEIYTRGIGARPALSGAVQQAQGWEELYVWPLSLGLLLLGCAYTRWPGKLRRISFARASASGRARLLMAWFMAVGLLFAFYWPSDASAQAMRGDTERKAWQAYNSKQWALARQLYAQVGGFRGHWGAGLSALNAGRAADAVE